jgi:hypothetical protein
MHTHLQYARACVLILPAQGREAEGSGQGGQPVWLQGLHENGTNETDGAKKQTHTNIANQFDSTLGSSELGA